ncbi:hypothetical protein BN1723_013142 [Verticillium longisporum]|uniref:Uncharacterized protein n=1 Tax=Verticillium longisporum TaxID=100787 RepID=A0A0G4LP93_VERLO|nr:hypothetical protein BN1723_013142 [Verticillium longisporum]
MCSKIFTVFRCNHSSPSYPPAEAPCASFRSAIARANQSNQQVESCPNYNEVKDEKDSYCPDCQAAGRGSPPLSTARYRSRKL